MRQAAETRTFDQRTVHDPAQSPASDRPRDHGPGLDIGWIAACAGLLLAAAVLGLSADRARSGSGGRFLAALRPLVSRR